MFSGARKRKTRLSKNKISRYETLNESHLSFFKNYFPSLCSALLFTNNFYCNLTISSLNLTTEPNFEDSFAYMHWCTNKLAEKNVNSYFFFLWISPSKTRIVPSIGYFECLVRKWVKLVGYGRCQAEEWRPAGGLPESYIIHNKLINRQITYDYSIHRRKLLVSLIWQHFSEEKKCTR